jgi:VanZ family protein
MAFAIRSRQMIAPFDDLHRIHRVITLMSRETSEDNPVLDAVLNFFSNSRISLLGSVCHAGKNCQYGAVRASRYLALRARSASLAAALGLSVGNSAFIQSCQLLFLRGRIADPADLLMNNLGTFLGAIIGMVTTGRSERSSPCAVATPRYVPAEQPAVRVALDH